MLEYNCRLGDPETQSILLRADFDFARACMEAAKGRLDATQAKWLPGASVCVVMAPEGYPASPILGDGNWGLSEASEVPRRCCVPRGNAKWHDGHYYTSGGRILGVAAVGPSLAKASELAYDAVSRIQNCRSALSAATSGSTGARARRMARGLEWVRCSIFSGAWCTAFRWRKLAEAEAIANKGFKGCIHGHSGSKRQVSLMDRETLDKFGLAPGR